MSSLAGRSVVMLLEACLVVRKEFLPLHIINVIQLCTDVHLAQLVDCEIPVPDTPHFLPCCGIQRMLEAIL